MNHSGNKPVLRLALCLGLVLAMPAFAKETGALRQAADLMAAPYSDAKVLGRVAENTRVEILERRGAWLHINAASKKGWVKLHQVRAGEGPEKKSGQGLTALKNVAQTGRSGSTGIVATTGIRGLSAEELKSAKPNPAAVQAMDTLAANETAAREQAQAAGLKERTVPALPRPQP